MKKRFRKIGIAARLTAVVAVILAVFLVPWVWPCGGPAGCGWARVSSATRIS